MKKFIEVALVLAILLLTGSAALGQVATNGSNPITLFDANTTCTDCRAAPPIGLVPPVGSMTAGDSSGPFFFSGSLVTLSGTNYGGATPKFGGGNGGPTGWIHVSYTVPTAGTYVLQFEVSHAGDKNYSSALAIDNIVSPQLNQSFEDGIPATWTLSGGASGFAGPTGGVSPSVPNLAPTNGSQFAWIMNGCQSGDAGNPTGCNNTLASVPTSYGSLYQGPGTNGLPASQGLGSPTVGTTLQSTTFTLAAGDTISFDVNFLTSDGTYGFSDFATVQLIATQTGAPINTAPTQTFTFNNATNMLDQYTADYSHAVGLTNNDATPIISDIQFGPTDWSNVVNGTPFATTACIPINGAGGNCTQKKQVCTTPTQTTPAGKFCPQSSERNILFSSKFDPVTLITDPTTVFGTVELNDSGACPLEGPAGFSESCPQNGLVSFIGPGEYTGSKGGKLSNSSNVWVTGVRPPSTTVTGFVNAAGWTNNPNPMGTLTGNPATLPPVPNNNMVVAAVASITYGTNAASSGLPSTLLPVPGDTTLVNPNPLPTTTTCPNPIPAQPPLPLPFGPNTVTLGPFADGSSNLLHYFTTDCATTEDLNFTFAGAKWSTNFNSLTINVDTTRPQVTPTLSPAPANNNGVPGSYLLHQNVGVTYSCTDPLPSGGGLASGVATCAVGAPSTLDTSTVGPHSFQVTATDVAGNQGTTTVNYTVVNQPVNLDVYGTAPSRVRPGSTISYFITALNLSQKNVASGVVVTDTVPAGTTVVPGKAFFCRTIFGCLIPSQGTPCMVSGPVVTCKIGSLAPLNTGAFVGIIIVVNVPSTTPLNTLLTDTATATSLNADTDGLDNSVTIKTTVVKSTSE